MRCTLKSLLEAAMQSGYAVPFPSIAVKVLQLSLMHGASGIAVNDLQKKSNTQFCKSNIGMRLAMVFGRSLRDALNDNHKEFNRLTIF